jgi:mycoredoxin-dependent peroxiredoxin
LLGISGDSVFAHKAWAAEEHLTFPLLQDNDHRVSTLYGSFNPQNGFNKRTIYVIDKDGVVRYKNLNFKPAAKEDYDALRTEVMKLVQTKSSSDKPSGK